MKILLPLIYITLLHFQSNAQAYIIKSIKDFGARGNGYADDQDAFVNASAFFNSRKGNGKLIIPKGIYIVGRQKFTGNDVKKNTPSYSGEQVLDLKNCTNLSIEGKPGAIMKCRAGLRIGTFSPVTGEPFKHEIKDINVKQGYGHYPTTVGIMIRMINCNEMKISGLQLDGNFDKFIFGGNWGNGRNAFELIHYGIYLIDCNTVNVKACDIKKFACDGIYIANLGKELKTYKINVDKCRVNYCGRNGLSWLGGENITVMNSVFSNSGQGTIHESPAAGIDIEVENNSFCRKGYFFNCTMLNNIGSAITSGSAMLSSDVLFKKCIAASPSYYTVFADAASHVFTDCKLYGTVLVWYRADSMKDAVQFRRCLFEDNYKGKKMYDGNYQLGAEATAVQVDSCIFRAYNTSSYYLKGLSADCNEGNTKMIRVSNSTFYNYCNKPFRLNENAAGIAGHAVFYNNKFYLQPSKKFLNGFEGSCHADAGKNEFFVLDKK